MRTITQWEFDNNSAAIMDAVARGETYLVTRDGVEVMELRPRGGRRKVTSVELMEICRRLPKVDYAKMRRDTDEAFGPDFLDEDDDPWTRSRG